MKKITLGTLWILSLVALSSCQSVKNPEMPQNTPSPVTPIVETKPVESVKVITINLPDVQFLVNIAKDKWFFEKNQVAPEFMSVQKWADKFLVGNQVDLKVGSMSNLVNIYLNGQDPVVLGVLNRPSTAYVFSRFPKDKLQNAKKVAVDMFWNDGQYSTLAFLKNQWLDAKKLEIIAVPDDNAKIEMLRSGKLDLAFLSSFKNEDNYAKEFTIFPFYGNDGLPGYNFNRAIITNKSALETKREALLKFTKSIYEALDYIQNNKEDSLAYAKEKFSFNDADATMFYDRFIKSIDASWYTLDTKTLEWVKNIVVEEQKIKDASRDLAGFTDTEFTKEATLK